MGDTSYGFRHEALFYECITEFVKTVAAFVQDGVEAGEPTLVMVEEPKIGPLQEALCSNADHVLFADMASIGRNPARIIPAWRRFVETHGRPGHPMRGVGEPVWAGRSPAELVECRHHESLLNVAFADSGPLWLLCPYDTSALADHVIAGAQTTHPCVSQHDTQRRENPSYEPADPAELLREDLAPPPADHLTLPFTSVKPVRQVVARYAQNLDASIATTVDDIVLAVNEVAGNSLRHGGGQGLLRLWKGNDSLVCQVEDAGHLADPLVGRQDPPVDKASGRGLWVVNHLCDLVQIRADDVGTTTRLHFGATAASPGFVPA